MNHARASRAYGPLLSLCALLAMHGEPVLASEAEHASASQIQMGEHVFRDRCVVCHGVMADGKSELAKIMRPAPANLRASTLTPEQKATIVRKGGEAVGRSSNMPIWELELNEAELQAVLAYIDSIRHVSQAATVRAQP